MSRSGQGLPPPTMCTAGLNPHADNSCDRVRSAGFSGTASGATHLTSPDALHRPHFCVSHMIAPVSHPHVSRPQTQRSSETSPSEPILARRPIRAHRSRTVSRGDLAICRAGRGPTRRSKVHTRYANPGSRMHSSMSSCGARPCHGGRADEHVGKIIRMPGVHRPTVIYGTRSGPGRWALQMQMPGTMGAVPCLQASASTVKTRLLCVGSIAHRASLTNATQGPAIRIYAGGVGRAVP